MAVTTTPERFIVDRHGRPTAVILSFVNYQRLVRLADDREDVRALKRARQTSRGLISHADLLARLKRHQLI